MPLRPPLENESDDLTKTLTTKRRSFFSKRPIPRCQAEITKSLSFAVSPDQFPGFAPKAKPENPDSPMDEETTRSRQTLEKSLGSPSFPTNPKDLVRKEATRINTSSPHIVAAKSILFTKSSCARKLPGLLSSRITPTFAIRVRARSTRLESASQPSRPQVFALDGASSSSSSSPCSLSQEPRKRKRPALKRSGSEGRFPPSEVETVFR